MSANDEFCEKVRQCENAMYALAFSIMKNEYDAADAMSESIMKAYSSMDKLRNDRAFKSWILKILHNTCLEMLRKKQDTVNIDEQYDLQEPDSGSDISTKLVLRQAVNKLNQPYRTIVTLYYYENLSLIEISKITGSSLVAVKKQLSRAREMLRTSLRKEDFF